MKFKTFRPPVPVSLCQALCVTMCVLTCIAHLSTAGRVPNAGNDPSNIFEMTIDDDEGQMLGDAEEQKMFQQFQKEQFAEFQKENGQLEDDSQESQNEDDEEQKRKEEEEEEAERQRAEQEKKEREERREQRRLQEEKEAEEEHARRQEELKEVERKRKQKEEEEKRGEEQRQHNKAWRDKHEGRKKSMTKQEKWQQEEAEQAELARKNFQQENFDDAETEKKKIEEAEAAELRILEPHVETHTKEEKEAIKERELHKEEHQDEVIDRLNPDEVLHQGEEKIPEEEKKKEEEGHNVHDAEDDEDCEECQKEKKEREAAELKAKLAEEAAELQILEPHVETHNKADKKMEEMMKDKPFLSGDIESAVHGGGHVHGEDHDTAVGIQGMDEVLETGRDIEEKGEIGVEDPEHFMHGEGEAHQHGSKDEKDKPGLAMPDDVMDHQGDFAHDDSRAEKKKAKTFEKEAPGVNIDDVEKAVHGEELAHDHTKDDLPGPGKRITKEDIEKLGLSQEMLKGVDLTKLLAKDQREYERYQNGDDYDDDDDDDDNKNSFWGQMSRIRKDYLDSLAARIRNIGVPDMETAEWDKNDLDDREMPTAEKTGELKEGETSLEHQMESWGSTAGKGKEGSVHGRFAPKIGEIP